MTRKRCKYWQTYGTECSTSSSSFLLLNMAYLFSHSLSGYVVVFVLRYYAYPIMHPYRNNMDWLENLHNTNCTPRSYINSQIIAATPDVKIFHTATEQKHSPYSDCTPRWPERRNPLVSQRSAPCCRSPSSCLVHTRFLYIVQPSSPTAARPCVVPQIVFPYDFPLFYFLLLISTIYYYSLDIAMHFTWYLVAIAGRWDADDDDNNYRDSLFSLTLYVRADNENFAQNHQRSLGLEFPSQFISFATTTPSQDAVSRFAIPCTSPPTLETRTRFNYSKPPGVETPTDQRIIFPAFSSAQHHTPHTTQQPLSV